MKPAPRENDPPPAALDADALQEIHESCCSAANCCRLALEQGLFTAMLIERLGPWHNCDRTLALRR